MNVEYILVYAKNYMELHPFEAVHELTALGDLVQQYKDEGKSWKYTSVLTFPGEKAYIGSTVDGDGNE